MGVKILPHSTGWAWRRGYRICYWIDSCWRWLGMAWRLIHLKICTHGTRRG